MTEVKPRLIERMADKPHYVYRHFDREGRLLYVGCTSQPKTGPRRHRKKPWWPEVAKTTLAGPMDYWAAGTAEHHAIDTEQPIWNVYGNRLVGGFTRDRYLAQLDWARVHREAIQAGLEGSGVVIACMNENRFTAQQAIDYLVMKKNGDGPRRPQREAS